MKGYAASLVSSKRLSQFGARCFVLHPTKEMTAKEMAQILVSALPRILAAARDDSRRRFVKIVNRQGRVRNLFP